MKIVAVGSIALILATMAYADGSEAESPPSKKSVAAAEQGPPADPSANPSDAPSTAATAAPSGMPPLDRVKATPKGGLKNPYTDANADIVAQGQKLYMKTGCNGCHGGGGGGGMCPPLSNDTWVYGGDDDTLFRLVSEGTDALQKDGYMRKGHENVVGPMPQHGMIIKSDDDLWKIITFIRSNYRGGPSKKFGDQPTAPATQ
ncbi:c-type cytochrome [Hydrocarboniphaga sp.]|uniref:c-type cytochrome n=1 Tax=Hydrocarboniphaga sp. TaxID=2033016 RepID=UPI002607759F|nr:c-type cytochrome [Hydrocarboniphaga sp.]